MKNKKQNNKKVVVKTQVKVAKPSISKMCFAFIRENKVTLSDNKKAFYPKLKAEILKVFPKSAFKETHYYWYITKFKQQEKLGLGLDCLKSIKKEVKKEVEAKSKKLEKREKAKKLMQVKKVKAKTKTKNK